MLLGIIKASNVVSKNKIIEKQTFVIVYTFLSFTNNHIVCDMFEDRYEIRCLHKLPSNENNFKARIQLFDIKHFFFNFLATFPKINSTIKIPGH